MPYIYVDPGHSPILINLSARPGFSLVYLGSLSSKENEFKISISFRLCPPLKNQVHLLILKKLKGALLKKGILILNSFSFGDKDPRFTRLKPGLALRLLSKELFYIMAMLLPSQLEIDHVTQEPTEVN